MVAIVVADELKRLLSIRPALHARLPDSCRECGARRVADCETAVAHGNDGVLS